MKKILLASLSLALATGLLYGAPIALPTAGLEAPRQPQVAVSAAGAIHVVFGDGQNIYSVSAPAGDFAFTAPVKVGALPKLALGMRRGPRLAATDATLLVTAISHDDGNVHGWLSQDAGMTWRKSERINTVEKSAREGLHALASDGRGLVACMWLDLRAGRMEVWSRVSPDGGATWRQEVRVYASPEGSVCPCCVPSVALGPHGEIAAMWRNALGGSRDMWTASSRDGGATFGEARKLGSGTWKLQACPMDGGGFAFGPDGALRTAWRRERTVFACGLDGATDLLAKDAAQPLVVSNGAKVATLWEQAGGIVLRSGDGELRQLAAPARMAAVAPLGTGFIAVWEEEAGKSLRLRAEKFE